MWTSSGGSRLKRRVKRTARDPAGRAAKVRKGKPRAAEWMNKFKYTPPAAPDAALASRTTAAAAATASTSSTSSFANPRISSSRPDLGADHREDRREIAAGGMPACAAQPQEAPLDLTEALAPREASQTRVDGGPWPRRQVGKLRPLVKKQLGGGGGGGAAEAETPRTTAWPASAFASPGNPQQAQTQLAQAETSGRFEAPRVGLKSAPMEIDADDDVENTDSVNLQDTRVSVSSKAQVDSLFSFDPLGSEAAPEVQHSPQRHERFFAGPADGLSDGNSSVLFFNNCHRVSAATARDGAEAGPHSGENSSAEKMDCDAGDPAPERLVRVLAVLRSGESGVFENSLDISELVDACVEAGPAAESVAVQVLFTMAESAAVQWTPVALEYARAKVRARFPGHPRLQSAFNRDGDLARPQE